MKTYQGSCHCGKVKFEAKLDLATHGTGKCNCSYCSKLRMWGAMVKPADFKLTAGQDELTDYQYGAKTNHMPFCRHCGFHPYAQCFIPALGGEIYSVNVACLDNLTPKEKSELKVQFYDGFTENWFTPPEHTKHL